MHRLFTKCPKTQLLTTARPLPSQWTGHQSLMLTQQCAIRHCLLRLARGTVYLTSTKLAGFNTNNTNPARYQLNRLLSSDCQTVGRPGRDAPNLFEVIETVAEQMEANEVSITESYLAGINETLKHIPMNKIWLDLLLAHLAKHPQRISFAGARITYNFASSLRAEPTVSQLVSYISLCASHGQEDEMIGTYQKLGKHFDKLDQQSCESLVKSLCLTSHWKEALNIVEKLRKAEWTAKTVYSHLVAAAFKAGAEDDAWTLLSASHHLSLHNFQLSRLAYETVLQSTNRNIVLKMLGLMEQNSVILNNELAALFKDWFTYKDKGNWKCEFTWQLNKSRCKNCGDKLKTVKLQLSDYLTLRELFLEKSLRRNGRIYVNTDPDELRRFQAFLNQAKPYDVVIDALSVAYRGAKAQGTERILKLVTYFREVHSKNLLVIARKHMESKIMTLLKTKKSIPEGAVQFFFTRNISSDDTFLIFAALYGSPGTMIVTRDHLRDHRFNLGDERMRALFMAWQRSHQIGFNGIHDDGKVMLEWPSGVDISVQKTARGWHIPYTQSSAETKTVIPSHHVTADWLCVQHTQT